MRFLRSITLWNYVAKIQIFWDSAKKLLLRIIITCVIVFKHHHQSNGCESMHRSA